MRVVKRRTAPIELKEAVIVPIGDRAESSEFAVHVFFNCSEPGNVVITPESAKLWYTKLAEQLNVGASGYLHC